MCFLPQQLMLLVKIRAEKFSSRLNWLSNMKFYCIVKSGVNYCRQSHDCKYNITCMNKISEIHISRKSCKLFQRIPPEIIEFVWSSKVLRNRSRIAGKSLKFLLVLTIIISLEKNMLYCIFFTTVLRYKRIPSDLYNGLVIFKIYIWCK